jgi:acetoin utilization deacetylase AcuC-like enzyme
VPPGAGGAEFVGLVEHLVGPVARAYGPDLIVVSAGYDAHSDDPLAACRLSTADYGTMSAHVRELGRELDAPILVCLEGGYDPGALAGSTLATIRALQAGGPPEQTAPAASVDEAATRVAGLDRWRSAF